MFSIFRKKPDAPKPQFKGEYKGLELPDKTATPTPDPNSFLMMMIRMQNAGIKFSTVLDVGASDGRWTELLQRRFSDAHYHLIEAKPIHQDALKNYAASQSNVTYVQAAAGNRIGTMEFYDPPNDEFGGRSADDYPLDDAQREHVIQVDATTLSEEVKKHQFKGPYLIKLDTHGHEAAILEGAAEILPDTSVLVLELYNLKIGKDCMLFHEMCSWLAERGFRCWDIFDVVRRSSDGVLWQFDAIFLPESFPAFQSTSL